MPALNRIKILVISNGKLSTIEVWVDMMNRFDDSQTFTPGCVVIMFWFAKRLDVASCNSFLPTVNLRQKRLLTSLTFCGTGQLLTTSTF